MKYDIAHQTQQSVFQLQWQCRQPHQKIEQHSHACGSGFGMSEIDLAL